MKYIFLISIIALTFISCETTRKEMLVNVTGKPGEILVVIDKNAWNSEPGQEIRKSLAKIQPALPQEEPMFKLFHIPPSSFGDFFEATRNIIYVKPCEPSDSASILSKYDMWAKPQSYMEITAPNREKLVELIANNSIRINEFFRLSELKRLQDTYKTFEEKSFSDKLKSHHLSLVIPKGYKMDVDSSDFVWITSETPNTSQGILIYEYNYTDTNTFTKEFILQKRDRVLKLHVPGPLPGSWMTTEHDFPVVIEEKNYKNRYVFEMRGLWKVQNDFMGGPFISISTVDEKRNKVITIEGYVYAPKYDKLDYIRQMEAILYSFKILED